MMGAALKTERENRGLTLKDIERETSIRATYLDALENGRYDALPNEVYVKGFIRNYAEFLHLNAEKLVQEYREEIHGADVEPLVQTTPASTSIVNERAPFSSGSDFHERVEKSHGKHIAFALVAAVVIAFVGSIYYFFGEDPSAPKPPMTAQQTGTQKPQAAQTQTPQPATQNQQTKPQTAQPQAQTQNAPAQPSVQNQQNQPPQPATIGNTASAAEGQAEVTAKFTGRCWVQTIADGKVIYEGMAEANQTLRWTGKKEVIVTAGNAGAIDVTYNGQRVGKLGKEGAVVEKKFSKGKMVDVK